MAGLQQAREAEHVVDVGLQQVAGGEEGGGEGEQQEKVGDRIASASARVWGRGVPRVSGSRMASTPTTAHSLGHRLITPRWAK